MTPQLRFAVILSVIYGAITSGTVATEFSRSIGNNPFHTALTSLLLVAVAVIAGVIAVGIRRRKPAITINKIAVLGLSAVYIITVLALKLSLSMLITPLCVLVGFLLLPGQQQWLASEKRP